MRSRAWTGNISISGRKLLRDAVESRIVENTDSQHDRSHVHSFDYTVSLLRFSMTDPNNPIGEPMIRTPILRLAMILAVAAIGLSACGGSDTTAETPAAPRTVKIEMQDISFSPDAIDVKAGETVRFVFTNNGALTHDAFIGDEKAQADHETEMLEMSGDGGHDAMGEEGAITLEPGKTGEFTHTFAADSDQLLIGCHEEGHYDAGMRITINMT